MIAGLRLIARLISFAAAVWILAVVVWGLVTGNKHIDTPVIAVWMFVGGVVAQLVLRLASKAARR